MDEKNGEQVESYRTGDGRRGEMLWLRVSKEEKEQIEARAASRGLSTADYQRMLHGLPLVRGFRRDPPDAHSGA